MSLKLLFLISDNEKKIKLLTDEFRLPFNTIMHGEGTASQGILDFLGLTKTEKIVFTSIISDTREKEILKFIKKEMQIKKNGQGVAFTISLTSAPQYINEVFKNKVGEKMNKSLNYHLLLTVVNEGYAEKVMNIAKKNGANGGTLIKGREIGNSSFKFFNVTVEPEKDILLIVCKSEDKNKIMESILSKFGANTEAKGICITLPIDNTIGVDE